jgi:hypothetical protein
VSLAQLRHRVAGDLAASVERARAVLVSGCWNELPGPRRGRSTSVQLEVTVDADGRALARSIQSTSADDDLAVVGCLQRADIPFTFTPPGERVEAQVLFSLP